MPRILLLVILFSVFCFVLTGEDVNFLPSDSRQTHNLHLLAPKGAYVTIRVYVNNEYVTGNEGIVPYDSKLNENEKNYYSDYQEPLDSVGYVENVVTFAELKDEHTQKLLRIEVAVILENSKEEYTYNFEENIVIEGLFDSALYVYNTGAIDIKIVFG